MLTKLMCWLFGHKIVSQYNDGGGFFGPRTVYTRHDFCLRCGKKIDE